MAVVLTCTECGYESEGFSFRWFPNDGIVLCKDELGCAQRSKSRARKNVHDRG